MDIVNPIVYHQAGWDEKRFQPARYKAVAHPLHGGERVEAELLRDPCMIREGGWYYLVHTIYPFHHHTERDPEKPDDNSSPGIFLYKSQDLQCWQPVGWLVRSADLPEDCPYKHRFWAPEITKINGKFYLTFTADNWIRKDYNRTGENGLYAFVGVADQVEGPYRHITEIIGAGCDTSLFGDDDGKTYAYSPGGDIFVQEIDLSGLERDSVTLVGEKQRIVTASNADIGLPWNFRWLEGPWMMKKKGRYYLFFAGIHHPEDRAEMVHPGPPGPGFEYWAGVAYSDTPMGPFRKDERGRIVFGGHLTTFDGPDCRPWYAFRGERPDPQTEGLLNIRPVIFEADGRIEADD